MWLDLYSLAGLSLIWSSERERDKGAEINWVRRVRRKFNRAVNVNWMNSASHYWLQDIHFPSFLSVRLNTRGHCNGHISLAAIFYYIIIITQEKYESHQMQIACCECWFSSPSSVNSHLALCLHSLVLDLCICSLIISHPLYQTQETSRSQGDV